MKQKTLNKIKIALSIFLVIFVVIVFMLGYYGKIVNYNNAYKDDYIMVVGDTDFKDDGTAIYRVLNIQGEENVAYSKEYVMSSTIVLDSTEKYHIYFKVKREDNFSIRRITRKKINIIITEKGFFVKVSDIIPTINLKITHVVGKE